MTITRTLATAATLAALLATPALAQHQHHHGQSQADSADTMMGGGMHGAMMGGSMMGRMMGGPMMGGSMMNGAMMGGGMMGMMQSMGPAPGMLLAASDALGLTEDQRERLHVLREESATQHRGHMQAAMATHRQASEALAGDEPDLQAYEEELQEAAGHMVRAHLAMTRAAIRARDVLTPEQRDELDGALSMMHEMGGGMMGGAAHGSPGDHGPGGGR